MKYVSYINSNVSCLHKLSKIIIIITIIIISTNTKIVVKGKDEGVEERKYGVVNGKKT
jgi:hypothetical protein